MFLDIIRGLHVTAAILWVGGGLVYLLVVRPAFLRQPPGQILPAIQQRLRDLTEVCILVALVSGIILTFDRLTSANLPLSYLGVLGLKLGIVAWMAIIAWNVWEQGALRRLTRKRGRGAPPRAGRSQLRSLATDPALQAALGIAALVLAEFLRVIAAR